jgi:hypothetical protein
MVADTTGYAGNGPGKNNPNMNRANNVGPLSRGNYMMGRDGNSSNTSPLTIRLTYLGSRWRRAIPAEPQPESVRIDDDRKGKPRDASKGCIVTPTAEPRKKIADGCGPGSLLTVSP